jgi:periplasmic divalent cation tolerance protein
MTPYAVVLTTAATPEEARRIADALVERRLAACVNVVGPIQSVYRWQGAIERAEERLLVIKTTTERFDEVRTAIRSLHSYDLPEAILLPVAEADADYARWIAECVARPGPD